MLEGLEFGAPCSYTECTLNYEIDMSILMARVECYTCLHLIKVPLLLLYNSVNTFLDSAY
jgi:hypothetical protein